MVYLPLATMMLSSKLGSAGSAVIVEDDVIALR